MATTTINPPESLNAPAASKPKQPRGRRAATQAKAKKTTKAEAQPKPTRKPAKVKPAMKGEPKPKHPTQGEVLVEMLRRKGGVTITEIMAELGVLAHSARALISVEARKKRGLNVMLDRATGRYSVA